MCRLHNQLSRSLLQHDAFLISRWLSTIEAAQTALGLPLLIQETSVRDGELSPRVRVNCKQRLVPPTISWSNKHSLCVSLAVCWT